MTVTAFGQAMLDSINGDPQTFRMSGENWGEPMVMRTDAFITLRPEERQILNECKLPDHANVLDYGCGIGRHLSYVRELRPQAHCFGIDIDDAMLDYCRESIGGQSTFVNHLSDLPKKEYDLIMLMGNGLGVLGCEKDAARTLNILVQSLSQKGCIVIETGYEHGGYFSQQHHIDYKEMTDGPFEWGYADQRWITHELTQSGCEVSIMNSTAAPPFFFAIGKKH